MTLVLVGKDLVFGGLTFKNRGLLRVPGTYLEYGRPWRFVFGLGMGPVQNKNKNPWVSLFVNLLLRRGKLHHGFG